MPVPSSKEIDAAVQRIRRDIESHSTGQYDYWAYATWLACMWIIKLLIIREGRQSGDITSFLPKDV